MVSAGEFRKGTTFEMDGNVYNVIEFMHVSQAKARHLFAQRLKTL